ARRSGGTASRSSLLAGVEAPKSRAAARAMISGFMLEPLSAILERCAPPVSLETPRAVGSLAPMLNTSARRALLPLVATLGLAAAACESTAVEPDYSQMLPPGSPALL